MRDLKKDTAHSADLVPFLAHVTAALNYADFDEVPKTAASATHVCTTHLNAPRRRIDCQLRRGSAFLLAEVAIESLKAREHKHGVEDLFLELGAPIPRRGESTVDARAAVAARAVEAVLEKVCQDASLRAKTKQVWGLGFGVWGWGFRV